MEFSRITVSGSETGPITGVQNIHADRNATIHYNVVPFQSSTKEREEQHNALNNFTCQLKRTYQTDGKWMKQLPWLMEQPIENYYVDLNLELLDATGRKSLARLCQLQDILRDEVQDLVTPAETILLSGPSGSGKTTLLRKMACLWASGTSPKLNKFKVVLIYSLKDLRDSEDLGEAITAILQQSYPDTSLVSLDIWLREVKDNMLLLLDGYDELSENGKANFGRILEKDSPFFSTTIIVTTRLFHDLEMNKRFVKHVKVSCLTDDSLSEGIDRYFSDDEENKQRIKKSVLTNTGCADLFRTSPLLMYSLCYVFETKEIADITKLTDLCFHVVTNLLKRAAMEEGNNLTEEEILSVLNCLGEISVELLFKGNPVFRLADLKSGCPNELNLILRSGLFFQKGKLDQEFEMLHNIFIEFLAVRYWNNQISEFSSRRCVKLKELISKQNYFKSLLAITSNNEAFLALQSAGIYMLIKDGNFGTEYVLETEYDFAVIEKKCEWRYRADLSNRWLQSFLLRVPGTAGLWEVFLTVIYEKKHRDTFANCITNTILRGAYIVFLRRFNQNNKYGFFIFNFTSQFVIALCNSLTSKATVKVGKSTLVGSAAIMLSTYPYLIISSVLFRYGGKRPILLACAKTYLLTYIIRVYHSNWELNDAVQIAFLALKKTRTILSATLLTTFLMWNRFSTQLFVSLLLNTCHKIFFMRDFPANGNVSSKIWNCAFPAVIVYTTTILIRKCFTKCIKYYLN